jgi:hypothetical protein
VNAENAANAANAAKLNGYDWGTIFSSADPVFGMLNVANAQVRGSISMGTVGASSLSSRTITLADNDSAGVLYGHSFGLLSRLPQGIHLGYNSYYDGRNGQIINSTGATSRLTVGYGFVGLYVGAVGALPVLTRLIANSNGVSVYGTFNNSSDRNAKQDFSSVSSAEILAKVAVLPISEWSYKEDPTARHIGPVGQDFYSIFKIGTDEKSIAPIDEGGIALAAIQALNQAVERKEKAIQNLQERVQKLERLLDKEIADEQ